MSERATEDRHALRTALTQTAMVRVEQKTKIDAYERESDALVQLGISRDEVIDRIVRGMALELEPGSTSADLVFCIAQSDIYKALVVHLQGGCVSAYTLCPL